MELLLDTHIYLWLVSGDERLSTDAEMLISNADAVYVSSASFWEIAIKVRSGKLRADLVELLCDLESNGLQILPVFAHHASVVSTMPEYHKDPFDRMLVAQAISENFYLMTADQQLTQYSEQVIRV